MNFNENNQNQKTQIKNTKKKNSINLAGVYAIVVYISLIASIVVDATEMKQFFTICTEMWYIGMLIQYNSYFYKIQNALYSFYEELLCIEDGFSNNKFVIRNKSGLNTPEISESIEYLYYKFSFSLICWFAHISIISIAFIIKYWRNFAQKPYVIIIALFILATYIGILTSKNHIIKIAVYRDHIKNSIKRLEEYEV